MQTTVGRKKKKKNKSRNPVGFTSVLCWAKFKIQPGLGSLICSVFQFLWYKYSHHDGFHAASIMSRNVELERYTVWDASSLLISIGLMEFCQVFSKAAKVSQ